MIMMPSPVGTVLITGASSGIGAEFARQLAARGSDLVLVARRADRLEELADAVRSEHGVRADVIPFDLSGDRPGQQLALELDTRGIRIDSLINCAGFGTHGLFAHEDAERIRLELAVNVTALVDVTHSLLPKLSGVLVNVASLLAYQPWPSAAVYGASKSFVLSFTEALWEETRRSGLRVLAVSPGPTRTEFFDVAGSEGMSAGAPMQTPAQVVSTALSALDRRNPPPSVVSGRTNKAISLISRMLTRRHTAVVFGRITARGTTS